MNLRNSNDLIQNEYIKKLFTHEDDTLLNARKNISAEQSHMCLGAAEAKIIELLIKLGNYKKIIEVGTLAGYTSIWMARSVASDGHIYTLEKSEENAAASQKNIDASDVKDKISLLQGDAHEELAKLSPKGPFDLIFIDADKGGYCKYLDWAEKNIRKGGLIIGDNTFLFGNVFDEQTEGRFAKPAEVMREFNKRLADSTKYTGIILPTAEGMTVAIKNF